MEVSEQRDMYKIIYFQYYDLRCHCNIYFSGRQDVDADKPSEKTYTNQQINEKLRGASVAKSLP